MKVQIVAATGEGTTLALAERPAPEPGPGEVRLRVRAVSLNHRDLLVRRAPGMIGTVPVSDGAGEIDAVGPGVTRWRPGDRVMALFIPEWVAGPWRRSHAQGALGQAGVDGVLAQQVVLPETAFVAIPPGLSFAEAATLPCAGVTAWNGLVERGQLAAGDTLLVQGTGGVALFALQIARALGVRCICISSSDDKLDRARALGAEVGINYRDRPDWDRAVLDATGGEGASHVLEIGGRDTFDRSLRAVAPEGRIIQVGVLTGGAQPDLRALIGANAEICGIYVGSGTHLERVAGFLETHAIRPVIDSTFAFADAEAAHEHLRSGRHFGKIVIEVD